MCFSVQVSFFSAALLAALSALTIKNSSRKSLMFASIPLLFAIQQFTEGFVWMYASKFAAAIYLAFVLIIWPFWIPISIFLIEPNNLQKNILKILSAIGILWSALLVYYLYSYGFSATVGEHIIYSFTTPLIFGSLGLSLLIYCIPVILPFFISTHRYMKLFGSLLAVSNLITIFVWKNYFTSIWCFFGAIISIGVYLIIKNLNR